MYRAQEQVRDFHRACGLRVEEHSPVIDWDDCIKLGFRLVKEEAEELFKAIRNRDAENFIQEMCDLLYVTFGLAVRNGIDLEPFFEEVHRANMAKCSGPKREDGKQLKPEGFQPADIHTVVHKRYNVIRLTEKRVSQHG